MAFYFEQTIKLINTLRECNRKIKSIKEKRQFRNQIKGYLKKIYINCVKRICLEINANLWDEIARAERRSEVIINGRSCSLSVWYERVLNPRMQSMADPLGRDRDTRPFWEEPSRASAGQDYQSQRNQSEGSLGKVQTISKLRKNNSLVGF